jgi:hydroxyacid-oxoacid transhydrogenase
VSCCHGYAGDETHESVFTVDAAAITFGHGALGEAGEHARAHGCKRVALFTDARVATLPPVDVVTRALRAAGIDVGVFAEVDVEPTDASFLRAAAFAREGSFDGFVSVGGGSVIDTCKAALLYATYPADLLTYVNKPIGEGRPVPGPLPLHIACPTTCGTGSECTGIAVFDYLALHAKTGIASRRLRPTHALIDPSATRSLPAMVVAASGFDVLCHAIESFTARPFTAREKPSAAAPRPMSQGQNPWSDLGSRAALELGGKYLARAVNDPSDHEAREGLAWAASLAGIAFGNSGVHLPHAMSYSVAGLVRDYRCDGYPGGEAMVPHGISVVVNAPSVFRTTAVASPQRHLEVASLLGADIRGAGPGDAGEALAGEMLRLMHATHVPLGIGALGYGSADLPALARGAIVQARLVDNAPIPVDEQAMRSLFEGALSYA